MITRLSVLTLTFFFNCFLHAQDKIVLNNQDGIQKKQSVLWEISGNGLKNASYLLGTIHVVPGSVLEDFPEVQKLMLASDKGMFEMWGEGSEVMDLELGKKMFPPLDSVFTKEQYAIVDTFFINHGYGSIKEHNNDASLHGMLHLTLQLKAYNEGKGIQYDAKLMELMIQNKKPVFRLDDPNVIAKFMLESWKPEQIARDLVALIQSKDVGPAFESTYDISTYTSSMKNNLNFGQFSPPGNKMFISANERNLLWLPKIVGHIKTGRCFIVVGLGHLSYKQGLISLLREKGYRLRPIILVSQHMHELCGE